MAKVICLTGGLASGKSTAARFHIFSKVLYIGNKDLF